MDHECASNRAVWQRLLVAVLLVCMLSGCASPEKKHRKTVQELFKTALEESRVRNEGTMRRMSDQKPENKRSKKQDHSEEETTDPQKSQRELMALFKWAGERAERVLNRVFGIESRSNNQQKQDEKERPVAGRRQLSGPPVTATFTQTQVRQAIQVIANQAGVNVLIGNQVQGLVSAQIRDAPFEQALQRLLIPLGFVYRQVSPTRYYVGSADPGTSMYPRLVVSRSYRAKETTPEKLRQLLPERYKKYVRLSGQQQRVLIEAPVRIAHQIKRRLASLDKPVPQVVIEAIVVVFSPESRFRFGLDLSQGIEVGGDDFVNVMLEDLNLSGAYGPAQFSQIRNFEFTSAFLQALSEEGYLTIRASPRVMARGGDEAKIRIGRQTFFSTTPDLDDTRFFDQDIRDVESGIVLEMVPTVREDEVLIDLQKAEVSEEIRTTQSATALNTDFPVINRRTVSTTVQVKNQETLVIGGLVQRRIVDQEANIPGLSDIPLLGYLFYEVDRQSQRREVAIFLSPRIVNK